MFAEGNIECVEKLLRPAKRVLKVGMPIKHDAFERRVDLWNKIRMNYDSYLDEECGSFLKDLDQHFCSLFDSGLLVLAASFKENGEFFGAADIFSDEELELYRKIERYDLFELLSAADIQKKLLQKDEKVLDLLKDYYVSMDSWVDAKLEDPTLRFTLRYYLKRKWDGYKAKLNEAVSTSVLELDWLKSLIKTWEHKTDAKVEATAKELEVKKEEVEDRVEELKAEVAHAGESLQQTEADKLRAEVQAQAAEAEVRRMEQQVNETAAEKSKVEAKLKQLTAERALLEGKGSRYVKFDEAKQYELNFIGRIENKLGNSVTFLGKTYKVDSLREIKQVDTSRFAEGFGLSSLDLKNLPENRALLAAFIEKKLLGKKKRYNFKALFSARVEKYAEIGYDTDPLQLKNLNACLLDARDEAKKMGDAGFLCLASPTGFEETVGSYINSEDFHRNFLSKYLSVCLLDLETGRQFYNPHDELAKEFAKLCEMETNAEKTEILKLSVKKEIDDAFLMNDYVVYGDIAKKSGFTSDIKPFFYDYAGKNGLEIQFVEDVGLVMMKKHA